MDAVAVPIGDVDVAARHVDARQPPHLPEAQLEHVQQLSLLAEDLCTGVERASVCRTTRVQAQWRVWPVGHTARRAHCRLTNLDAPAGVLGDIHVITERRDSDGIIKLAGRAARAANAAHKLAGRGEHLCRCPDAMSRGLCRREWPGARGRRRVQRVAAGGCG